MVASMSPRQEGQYAYHLCWLDVDAAIDNNFTVPEKAAR